MRITLILMLFLLNIPAYGERAISQKEIQNLLSAKIANIKLMASFQEIIQSVAEQNAKRTPLNKIKEIDEQWISTKELTPFKFSLQETKVGKFLRGIISLNESVYNEAFLTDNQGANVAAYPVTSDYWQGDETKWIASFNNGDGKVYIGSVEFDESTDVYAIQISVPVIDKNQTIGVLVMGIKLSHLERMRLHVKSSK